MAIAPRLSLLLPTGERGRDAASGGMGTANNAADQHSAQPLPRDQLERGRDVDSAGAE